MVSYYENLGSAQILAGQQRAAVQTLPAPLPRTGWYLGPYLFNWGRHAAYLLQSHGMTGDPVDIHPSGPVSGYEDVAVTAVSGWR